MYYVIDARSDAVRFEEPTRAAAEKTAAALNAFQKSCGHAPTFGVSNAPTLEPLRSMLGFAR